jgi:hypothetical protein
VTSRVVRFTASSLTTLGLAASLPACDPQDGEAMLRVHIYGEEFIEDKIPADVLVDGWELDFAVFLVAVSDIAADEEPLNGAYLFDLTASSGGAGHSVGEIIVPAGTTAHLNYRLAPVSSFDGGNATTEQRSIMTDGGYSMYVEGTATRGNESKSFAWGFSQDTAYTHCHIDRELSDGESDDVEITIHADHLFYDDLDSETPNVAFDIMARADANGDGTVTADEMAAVDITGEARYQVGSRPIDDLWNFVVAQTATVGHIDGEGHCNAG